MTHIKHLLPITLLFVVLAGCRSAPAAGGAGSGQASFGGDEAIRWERDPSHVIFQIDVTGGEQAFGSRDDIPLCAVYGDNRVVWLDNTQPNRTIILFDVLEDLEIYNFVADLTVNKRLFTYDGEIALLYPEGERPVYEEIVLDVNGTRYVTDGFGGWPDGFFQDVLAECTSLSETPALYEPTAGWLSAQAVEYDPQAAVIYWNPQGAGVDLSILAEDAERIWVDDPVRVRRLWNIRTNSPRYRLFEQNGEYFQMAFEVPNIHPSAPPAPMPDQLERARSLPSDRD